MMRCNLTVWNPWHNLSCFSLKQVCLALKGLKICSWPWVKVCGSWSTKTGEVQASRPEDTGQGVIAISNPKSCHLPSMATGDTGQWKGPNPWTPATLSHCPRWAKPMPLRLLMLGLSGQVNVPVASKLLTKHIGLAAILLPVLGQILLKHVPVFLLPCSIQHTGLESFLTFSSPATVASWPAAVMWDPHSALTVYVTI